MQLQKNELEPKYGLPFSDDEPAFTQQIFSTELGARIRDKVIGFLLLGSLPEQAAYRGERLSKSKPPSEMAKINPLL